MREILGFFGVLVVCGLADEHLHLHSLKHVQKRHDIPLEFIMNSQEHSDIRRSVKPEKDSIVQRLSSDKFVVRRDDPKESSSEVVGDSKSVPDKFDQPSYDFMLPEGVAETPTILAVVDFITTKNGEVPKFMVNFDEQNWFDIGEVQKTKADNADVYKATVILKKGANVKISATENGLYKFVVEAQQGDVVLATTNIMVDVISLEPTTKRVMKVTVPTAPMTESTVATTVVEDDEKLIEIKTTKLETTTMMESDESEEEEVTSEEFNAFGAMNSSRSMEKVTGSMEVTVVPLMTTVGSMEETTVSLVPLTSSMATTVEDLVLPMEEEEGSMNSTAGSMETTTVSMDTTEDEKEDIEETEGSMNSTASSMETTTSSMETTISSMDLSTSSMDTTPSSIDDEDDKVESKESMATTIESMETTASSMETTTSSMDSSSSSMEVEIETTPSTTESTSSMPTTTSSMVLESSGDSSEGSADTIESSGSSELLTTSSEETDNPIDGPITILPVKSENIEPSQDPIDATIELAGLKDGMVKVAGNTHRIGDMIHGVSMMFNSKLKNVELHLSTEPENIIELRPNTLYPGESSMIFLASEKLKNVDIIGKTSNGIVIRQPVVFDVQPAVTVDTVVGKLRELEFGVMENAENGRKIGRVEEEVKIVGSSNDKRFSLIGNDIVLTCGQFSTERCLLNSGEEEFTMMLMPRNGSLSPIQVTIRVQQEASLRTSDDVIRISDNRIITPFAVITERTSKSVKLSGEAARFLISRKSEDGLYQLIVSNSASSGKYQLEIQLEGVESSKKVIQVFVENSLSHAHFRKSKYFAEIDGKAAKEGMKILQVELEGVPIDEAKIIILDGNPGWVTVEGYGGRVKVGNYDGKVYNGKSSVRIGALDIKTWTILTETTVELEVVNGEELEEKEEVDLPRSTVIEMTFDREKTERFDVPIDDVKSMKVVDESVFGIDENGQMVKLMKTIFHLHKSSVEFSKSSLKSLRLVSLTLDGPQNRRDTILLRLVSSPEYLEQMEKESLRPIYPEPWTKENNVIIVEMNEELLPGQIVGVFPAIIPNKNEPAFAKMGGAMRDAFEYDGLTGTLVIRQKIDYESLSEEQKSFDIMLESGEVGYESRAVLRIKVMDIDDNSPIIGNQGVTTVSLPENLPIGAKIVEFPIEDLDGSDYYNVSISGVGSDHFFANISDTGLLGIYLTKQLDRETRDTQSLIVQVEDISSNSDRILLPINILDINDNSPVFDKKMYEVEVVEDWPIGVVLEKMTAKDVDLLDAGRVRYELVGEEFGELFTINSTTGLITVSSSLYGLSRSKPYQYQIYAIDHGTPSLNSTAILNIKILSKDDLMVDNFIEFVDPPMNFDLVVKENTKKDEKIYKVKAEKRGIEAKNGGELEYVLKNLDDEDEKVFAIDKVSGEIFVTGDVDFERKNEYLLQITATNTENEELTASTTLHIIIEDVDDNQPEFLESATQLFTIPLNTTKSTTIGRVTAYDVDQNDTVYYHILPKCGTTQMTQNFTIDEEFGEIVYHPQHILTENSNVDLCIVANSAKNSDLNDIFFDTSAKNMKKVTVAIENEDGTVMEQSARIVGNSTVAVIGDSLDGQKIPMEMNSLPKAVNYKLQSLNFVPANYELGRDIISPEGSVELNEKTGELVANGKIIDTPQGVYTADITTNHGQRGVKQLHHIQNERKLRYVLAMSKNEFGANSEKLKRQLYEAIEEEKEKQLMVYFDEPQMYHKNSTWTSVCFYMTRENAILDDKQMNSLISSSNGHIAKLHHIFKVINVEECAPKSNVINAGSEWQLPQNTLILIAVVCSLIIILIALLVYICCVSKYRRYLENKEGKLRSSTPLSYYKSPNLLPPPGYVHSPPPPQAIGFY